MVTFSVDVPDNFSKSEVEDWLGRQGYTRIHSRRGKKLEVIQDRFKVDDENRSRLTEALEAALRYGHGKVTVYPLNDAREAGKAHHYTTEFERLWQNHGNRLCASHS